MFLSGTDILIQSGDALPLSAAIYNTLPKRLPAPLRHQAQAAIDLALRTALPSRPVASDKSMPSAPACRSQRPPTAGSPDPNTTRSSCPRRTQHTPTRLKHDQAPQEDSGIVVFSYLALSIPGSYVNGHHRQKRQKTSSRKKGLTPILPGTPQKKPDGKPPHLPPSSPNARYFARNKTREKKKKKTNMEEEKSGNL